MKNIFLKEMTFEEQNILHKVIIGLTFILFLCAAVMSWFGVYADFNSGAADLLGMFCLVSLCFKKDVKKDIRTVFLATLLVGDAMYVLSLFFLLGRTFMQNL